MITRKPPDATLREPYKYLDYYRLEDVDLFFGREREVQKTVGEIVSARLLVLFSPSGSGKSSLINAGVRPELEKLGYSTVYTRLGSNPIYSIEDAVAERLDIEDDGDGTDLAGFLRRATEAADKPLVIFLDQFEEFFVLYPDNEELRTRFIEQLAEVRYDAELPVYVVLSLREDYFASLHELRGAIPSIFHHNANVRLERFTKRQSVRAIEGPLEVIGGSIDEGLAERIFEDLAENHAKVEPIKLQVVCQHLWQRRTPENKITTLDYDACGGAEKILADDLAERLGSIPRSHHRLMKRLFEALKTPDGTKRFRSEEELVEAVGWRSEDKLRDLLALLVEKKLLRWETGSGTTWYELRHDYLVDAIREWLAELESVLAKRRFWLGAIPGVIMFVALLAYIGVSYVTAYAALRPAQYDSQQEEVVIERGRPFGVKIFSDIGTTGLYLDDLLDLEARNRVRAQLHLGLFAEKKWELLNEVLKRAPAGRFQIELGHDEQGKETLLEALTDDSPSARSAAAKALRDIDTAEERVIEALLEALQDADGVVRSSAAEALGDIGAKEERVIEALLEALQGPESLARSSAAEALGDVGAKEERVIDALLKTLRDSFPSVRSSAAEALSGVGADEEKVTDSLLEALRDSGQFVGSAAAAALGNVGATDERAIDALLEALRYSFFTHVRSNAAAALGDVGTDEEKVIVALLAALRDSERFVRSAAAKALGDVGTDGERVTSALLKTLRDSDNFVRSSAAEALGDVGTDEEKVIVALLAALQDSTPRVRSAAAVALGKVGAEEERVIDALLEALQDSTPSVRNYAAATLGDIGAGEEGVIVTLLETLQDSDNFVRRFAAEALGDAGSDEGKVTDALLQALRDSDRLVRKPAAEALGNLLRAKPVGELLTDLTHRESARRTAAAQALVRKETLSEETLARIDELRRSSQLPWARLGGAETARLIRQRRRAEGKADRLMVDGTRLLDSGEHRKAARRYVAAYEQLTRPIRLRKQGAAAALQAARCYAKLGRPQPAVQYLEAAFDNDPSLRVIFKTELAQPSNDWESLREDRRLEKLLAKTTSTQNR